MSRSGLERRLSKFVEEWEVITIIELKGPFWIIFVFFTSLITRQLKVSLISWGFGWLHLLPIFRPWFILRPIPRHLLMGINMEGSFYGLFLGTSMLNLSKILSDLSDLRSPHKWKEGFPLHWMGHSKVSLRGCLGKHPSLLPFQLGWQSLRCVWIWALPFCTSSSYC